MEAQKKCHYPDGWDIKIGPFSMDPCRYHIVEEYPALVSILKCRKCGRHKLIWTRKATDRDNLEQHQKYLELKHRQECVIPCSLFKGWKVSILNQEIDICDYEVTEHYENALVSIVKCVKCGYRDMRWEVLDETEEQDFTEI